MIKLFTHTDLDGIGCAILARLAFADDVDITYCDYDDINNEIYRRIQSDKILNYDMVFITDISIEEENAVILDGISYVKIKLLDHHPTAQHLNKYDWCTIKIEDEETHIKTSGTELYYNWLINHGYLNKDGNLDRFVEIVRDYDTWRWSQLGEKGIICKQINDLLYLYGRERFVNWCIAKIKFDSFSKFPNLSDTEKLVLEIKQREIDKYIVEKNKQIIFLELCGKQCGFVFAENYFSELGNKLCKLNPDIDLIAMIDIASKAVSYRTIKDDIDLGKDIAQLFGGGGHPKSAGSKFSENVQFKVIEKIFN